MSRAKKKEDVFFTMYREFATEVNVASDVFVELFDAYPDKPELIDSVKEHEVKCDRLSSKIMTEIQNSFITPFDRIDMSDMVRDFDDIVDNMEGTAARLKLFNVHAIPGEAYEVVHLIDEACACVQTMFDALPEYKTNKTVTEQAVRILDLEDQGDTYYRRGLGNLFIEGADPIHVVKWKSLFDSLERCMDSCKDLANSVLGVVMENA